MRKFQFFKIRTASIQPYVHKRKEEGGVKCVSFLNLANRNYIVEWIQVDTIFSFFFIFINFQEYNTIGSRRQTGSRMMCWWLKYSWAHIQNTLMCGGGQTIQSTRELFCYHIFIMKWLWKINFYVSTFYYLYISTTRSLFIHVFVKFIYSSIHPSILTTVYAK